MRGRTRAGLNYAPGRWGLWTSHAWIKNCSTASVLFYTARTLNSTAQSQVTLYRCGQSTYERPSNDRRKGLAL